MARSSEADMESPFGEDLPNARSIALESLTFVVGYMLILVELLKRVNVNS